MQIVLASQDFPPDIGGTQTYASELARRWSDSHDVTVVAPRVSGAGALDGSLPYPVVRVRGGHNRFAFEARSALKRLRLTQPDSIVFCVQWTAALAALLAGWPRRQIALAAHGRELLFNPLPPGLGFIYGAIRGWVVRSVGIVLPVSRYTAGLAEAIRGPSGIHVVANGTDPDRFRPVDAEDLRESLADGPLLVSVCRLVPRKGVDLLIRSMPEIARRHPGATLAVVGSGPERPALERLASAVQAPVRFTGAVEYDALPRYFSAADLFVMTPRTIPPDVEGFGLVYLEANACGVPVIGTRSGGIPDAIRDGETGLVIEPDDQEALVRAVDELLSDHDRRAEMAANGRRFAETEGSWDRAAHRMLQILESD